MEQTKKVFGIIFLSFATIGVIVALSFQLKFGIFDREGTVFDWHEGGNSNLPLFYGFCALAGAFLISKVKTQEVKTEKEKDNEIKKLIDNE